MYKYFMTIDNEPYNALFADHMEAADFLDEVDRDGSEVIVHKYTEVSAMDILNDNDFEYAYRIEMASMLLLPNYRDFKKFTEMEVELQKLGYIA